MLDTKDLSKAGSAASYVTPMGVTWGSGLVTKCDQVDMNNAAIRRANGSDHSYVCSVLKP